MREHFQYREFQCQKFHFLDSLLPFYLTRFWDNYYIFGGLIITLISNLQGNAQDKMCYRNVSQCMTKDKSPYHIGWALPGPFPGSKLRGQITDQITAFFQKRKPSFSDT